MRICTAFNIISTLLLSVSPDMVRSDSPTPKRGIVYISNPHPRDYSMLTSGNSPLTWYYTWSPWPALQGSSLEFVPMVHGGANVESDIGTVKSSASSNGVKHLLVFNEPDGDTASGGSNIEPEDAARLWIDEIAALRGNPWNLQVSLPATTGSGRGLDWLTSFNASCFELNPGRGCEFDFIAAHWYGDFAGMASWLGTLHSRWPDYDIWLTEFAIPSASDEATAQMLNQSLPFLDDTDWIARYSWFGAFRRDDANEWTGDAVSFWDHDGRLTDIGSAYLGGASKGFAVGARAGGGAVGALRVDVRLLCAGLFVVATMVIL